MIFPKLEECRKYVTDYSYIPVADTILADERTPIEVLRALRSAGKRCFILESAEHGKWGRYTFIGYDPELELTCTDGDLRIRNVADNSFVCERHTEHPASDIRELLEKYRSPVIEGMPSFTGGLMGYFSYDYIKYNEERLRIETEDSEGFADVDLMLFDRLIAFDHFRQKIYFIVNLKLDEIDEEYEKAAARIKEMRDAAFGRYSDEEFKGSLKSELKPRFSKEQFCSMVDKAKEYIFDGDIFQVVLSNCLTGEYEGSLMNTYRQLRSLNPSPYMFYFASDTLEVAGASPETLVKLENGVLHTFPLAGSSKRGVNEAEDAAFEAALLSDEKELAEHNMLVDLGRNDLGRVSRFGTVEVEKYKQVEKYSHIMHISSTVRGVMSEDMDAIDAINAVLPAGTLSGAPKIRACEIIAKLEKDKRGIYGGAVGYIDFTGNMDMCIAIRLAYKKNGKVHVRSGAGIVSDSVPEKEFEESLNKAKAVVVAMEEGNA
jgi:anthranilate synthase component 1